MNQQFTVDDYLHWREEKHDGSTELAHKDWKPRNEWSNRDLVYGGYTHLLQTLKCQHNQKLTV